MDPDLFILLIVLAAWLAIGALGGYIGAARGHRGLGIALGLLLGPIGCIIAAILPQRAGSSAAGASYSGTGAVVDYQRWQQQQSAARATREPPTLPLRIRRGTEELGAWTFEEICTYLADGRLSMEDDYYDLQSRTWLPVASMPWL